MTPEQVAARCAIEALRSGVPSRRVVEQLGTTQDAIRTAFDQRLTAMAAGESVPPLVVSATFGAGKSHLLSFLQALASKAGCVTSYVIASPEMPLGNSHVVLKALAEAATAPGYEGRALREMAARLKPNSGAFAEVRNWARDSKLHDRFSAALFLYEEMQGDEEFRTRLLADVEGSPVLITELRARLKPLGQQAGYDLRSVKNALLAHDRIRLLARFYHACGAPGWVVLFDECERLARFTTKQRLTAWTELAWWKQAAETAGARLLPVFALHSQLVQEAIDSDSFRFSTMSLPLEERDWNRLGQEGIELFRNPLRLDPPDRAQEKAIEYRVKALYEEAYPGWSAPDPESRTDVWTTIRAEIRRWITIWDLQRCYPEYRPDVLAEEVQLDTSEIEEEVTAQNDDDAE